jgi:type II secretory pathway component PulL
VVQLKEFTWVQPSLAPRELLQAIESAIPVEAIETAIQQSHSQHQRERALPTSLVVALVIALNIWAQNSIVDVLKNLVTGLSQQWIRLGQRWRVPSKSSISEGRQRVAPDGGGWQCV